MMGADATSHHHTDGGWAGWNPSASASTPAIVIGRHSGQQGLPPLPHSGLAPRGGGGDPTTTRATTGHPREDPPA